MKTEAIENRIVDSASSSVGPRNPGRSLAQMRPTGRKAVGVLVEQMRFLLYVVEDPDLAEIVRVGRTESHLETFEMNSDWFQRKIVQLLSSRLGECWAFYHRNSDTRKTALSCHVVSAYFGGSSV